MHETQQPRDPKKTTGIVYAVILVVLLLLNFWAFPAMMKGQPMQGMQKLFGLWLFTGEFLCYNDEVHN